MPRRRKSAAPLSTTDVLLGRISSLEEQVKILRQAKASSIQTLDTVNYNDPAQGELVIDWPTGCIMYYHINEWHPVDGDCMETLKGKIVATSSGDTTVIAGVANKQIRVIAFDFLSSIKVDVKFKSGATDISGVYAVPKTGGKVNPANHSGWMQCGTGQALVINLSVASVLGGVITYVLKDPPV